MKSFYDFMKNITFCAQKCRHITLRKAKKKQKKTTKKPNKQNNNPPKKTENKVKIAFYLTLKNQIVS